MVVIIDSHVSALTRTDAPLYREIVGSLNATEGLVSLQRYHNYGTKSVFPAISIT